MKNFFTLTFGAITISFALVFFIQLVYAWTEPSQIPPGGNVAAPLNVGSVTQYKSGALGVGGAFRGYSTGIFDGNVGIGTASPGAKLDVNGDVSINDKKLKLRAPGDLWHMLYFNTADNYEAFKANSGVEIGDGTTWYTRLAGASGVVSYFNAGNVGIGTTAPSQKLDVVGYVKGQSGLCIGNDCRTAWPGASSILVTLNGGRTDLCDNCTQTGISGSLTAPANGVLTIDYSLLMDSPWCGIVISTYVDNVKIRQENVKGCFGPLKAGNSDCPDATTPSQAFIYKAAVSAGSHSFRVDGWTGGGSCGNTRGFQVSPAYLQWQP